MGEFFSKVYKEVDKAWMGAKSCNWRWSSCVTSSLQWNGGAAKVEVQWRWSRSSRVLTCNGNAGGVVGGDAVAEDLQRGTDLVEEEGDVKVVSGDEG